MVFIVKKDVLRGELTVICVMLFTGSLGIDYSTTSPSPTTTGVPSVEVTGSPGIDYNTTSSSPTTTGVPSVEVTGSPGIDYNTTSPSPTTTGIPSVAVTGSPGINYNTTSPSPTTTDVPPVEVTGSPGIDYNTTSPSPTTTGIPSVAVTGSPGIDYNTTSPSPTTTGVPSVEVTGSPGIDYNTTSPSLTTTDVPPVEVTGSPGIDYNTTSPSPTTTGVPSFEVTGSPGIDYNTTSPSPTTTGVPPVEVTGSPGIDYNTSSSSPTTTGVPSVAVTGSPGIDYNTTSPSPTITGVPSVAVTGSPGINYNTTTPSQKTTSIHSVKVTSSPGINYNTTTPSQKTTTIHFVKVTGSRGINYNTTTPSNKTTSIPSVKVTGSRGIDYNTTSPSPTTTSVDSFIVADSCEDYDTTHISLTNTALNIKSDGCRTTGCLTNLLDQIENITAQDLPFNNITYLLELIFKTSEKTLPSLSLDPNNLVSAGNHLIRVSEELVSMLVKPTSNCSNVSFTRDTLEAQVFMVGPNVTLHKNPQLSTKNAVMDIDLIEIAKKNYGSAAVTLMSYNTMEDLLKPDFFSTSDDTVKIMMSTVISATLPKTTNKQLTKPVNFTLKHIKEFLSGGNLYCVYWNITEWIVDGCSVIKTNSSYTVCSCLHLSTFALILETNSPPEDDPLMELLNLVFVIVGLVFTSLALLTFAFCRWKPGVNNVARINLCISLLSAHLLFLLTQQFIKLIKPHKELCAVISGALHFFFLSCFVWMFIEAVLLFICVKNLSQISSKQRAVLKSRFLIVIGYAIAAVIVGVSAGVVPEGYGSEQCWIKQEKGFIWSFLGPVYFIVAINTILFISIIISLNSALKNLTAEVSCMKQTKIMVFKTLAQFVIFGCPWILGFFIINNQMMMILFLILNSQQGTFIFLVYCVLSDEVRRQYIKWLRALLSGCKFSEPSNMPPKNTRLNKLD
nr:adhesion G protein-coupled receptor E2-like [Misgurnus anguillicaudatus]